MKTVKFFAAHVIPNLLFLLAILLGCLPSIHVPSLHPLSGGDKDLFAHVH